MEGGFDGESIQNITFLNSLKPTMFSIVENMFWNMEPLLHFSSHYFHIYLYLYQQMDHS